MVSYGRTTRSRAIYHFWPLKGIHLLSISEFINPYGIDLCEWLIIFHPEKKGKIVLWFGGVISWTLIIPYSESTGVDQSYLKLLEGTPRTVKKNPWLFRHMLLKQWEKKISERVWNTHTTKCMRLLPIPYGKRKMTLQWKLVLDLGIFRLNHHWWKSLLVKLDIKMTLTNKLGKKTTKSLPYFLKQKKHLPLELLSPRSPKTPKTDRSFLGVHTGILRICSKVSKRSKPPTFVLEWIPGGFSF